jgi:hypothetical protein
MGTPLIGPILCLYFSVKINLTFLKSNECSQWTPDKINVYVTGQEKIFEAYK